MAIKIHCNVLEMEWLNDQGVWETRRIVPDTPNALEFKNFPGAPEVQWYLNAWDVDRFARRTFPLLRIKEFREIPHGH